MPAYNAEAFVSAALDSVFAQDYERFEVIVVDDGSTDSTPEIVRRFPSAKLIQQENGGPAAAYNTGVAASSGEFVATFDADDLWPTDRLRVQSEYLVAHPAIGCVLGRQEWMNPPPWLTRDAVYGDLDGIPLVSAMFRRSVLQEVGGFDERFRRGEDMDLLVRLRGAGIQITVLPHLLVYRRFHGGNLTAGKEERNPLLRSLREKLERDHKAVPAPPRAGA
jgi:glycosyltransferase involved in cell wall biosynthesis